MIDHINLIKDKIENSNLPENALVIIEKIRPADFLKLSKFYRPLIDFEDILIKDKGMWDSDLIAVKNKTIIRSLLDIKGCTIVPAELIYFISGKFQLSQIDVPVTIYSNNATDFTPCYIDGLIESLYENIEKDISNTEEQAISDYYVNSVKINNSIFVQSNAGSLFENQEAETILLFECREVELKKSTGSSVHKYDFNHAGSDYYSLITDFYSEQLPNYFQVLVQTQDQITSELECFMAACQLWGQSVDVIQERKYGVLEVRQELKDLRARYWAKGSDFRMVTFYADPAISSDTIEISQGEIVEQIVSKAEQTLTTETIEDVFITAPTGAGKSLLFQLAAIFLAEKYEMVTIVISPLKSLMKDQVVNLKEQGYQKVAFVNSDISLIQREEILGAVKNNLIDILYLAPELLLSYSLDFFIGERSLGLLIIDEAHLVTTWGRDFRVDYWFLGNYIRKIRQLYKQRCIIVSLTATAVYGGPDDLVFETVSSLNMIMPTFYIGVVRRNDIKFFFKRTDFDTEYESLRIEHTANKVVELINKQMKSIVYFPWTSQIETVYNKLGKEKKKVAKFHSKLDKGYRLGAAEDFRSGSISVILASKAFGMGVDIPDIEYVYHHAPSGMLADYVQEIGRAARLPDINGIAAIDFSVKDLRYTKVLWGLSAIRQWQVKQSLSKLVSLYQIKKKRNFLVNIDDFSYIFPNANQGSQENKIKSTLMLIEKDFLKKHRYPVVIVRPKSLFTTVFVRVENIIKKEFLDIYSKYVNKLEGVEVEASIPNGNEVFKLKLDKLWEDLFPKMGFPSLKRDYFNGSLFGDFSDKVHPQLKLMLKLNGSITQIQTALDASLTKIDIILGRMSGKFFTRIDFLKALDNEGFNSEAAESIADVFLNYYSSKLMKNPRSGKWYYETAGAFLQQRMQGDIVTYKVIDYGFIKAKESIRKKFRNRFRSSSTVFAYITTNNQKNRDRILLAYVLEALKLGVYELQGGEKPQLFIRINDPAKVFRELSSYNNVLVDDIEFRHHNSMRLMERFFMTEMTSKQRWDFIEDYFLGKQIDEEDND